MKMSRESGDNGSSVRCKCLESLVIIARVSDENVSSIW